MSDRFRPISMEQLVEWTFTELDQKDSLFGIPRQAFFVPGPEHRFRLRQHGVELETPYGVAAGPHTQLAQNIVAAWLVGARVIELKTVQTLDEIEVHKPCIDVEDEGYNVEWSQELKIHQSFDEYLRAWVLIHALHRRFGWPGDRPGIVFNMSVGYNYEGIQQPNVQWYLDAMADASPWLSRYVEIVARREPAIGDIDVPARLSDTITLSTMHGCPPGEIERISRYLLEERRLHTSVKCNPTLLGSALVRGIVNDDLGYTDVQIPDEAFGHDLTYADAIPMFRRLQAVAATNDLDFGLKLSNTLEVENSRSVFGGDATMYLSGRPLHAVTANLAATISDEFHGSMPLSFAGGADCFNAARLIRSGMETVTVASDLLKTGGYLRLLQYTENLNAAFDEVHASDTSDFVCKTALGAPNVSQALALLRDSTALRDGVALSDKQCLGLLDAIRPTAAGIPVLDTARAWAESAGFDSAGAEAVASLTARALARLNLRRYAESTRSDWRYRKESFRTDRSKTSRPLHSFDCIQAPCVDTCPVGQQVPLYMDAVRRGDLVEAARVVRQDNPLPCVLGRVCDHLCESTCVRTHLDQPLAIRQIKRFIMDEEASTPDVGGAAANGRRVAVVGAGPAGLAAARELAGAGFAVTIFEARPYPGGMVGGAIPAYRLPQAQIDRDLAGLARLGVEIRYSMRGGVDFTIQRLRDEGFDAIFVAIGAQIGRKLHLPGEDARGVIDGVELLREVREGRSVRIGPRVGVVGAGDTAMDCARSALRVGAADVSLIYRRTVDQMPADREEIQAIREEGVDIVDRARPTSLRVVGGRLAGVVCVRTEYRGERDASGRKIPFDVPGSEFEIELDTLILAVSQQPALDCFDGALPDLTPQGYIAVDPLTLETSIPGVYAGGDIAGDGPASIVRAAADGKRAARAIAESFGVGTGREPAGDGEIDFQDLVLRRGRRQYRVPIATSSVSDREGFDETVLGYTHDEAVAEAARCLRCDELCSLCVGVCPNMALMTYEIDPTEVMVPTLASAGSALTEVGATPFAVGQRYQVAVLADFCNECGTCVTACPSSGAPYRDKPRLFANREDFEAERSNAFLLLPGLAMEGRFDGSTHKLEIDARITYSSPALRAVIDPATFAVLEAEPRAAEPGATYSLEPAAVMATLLAGLARSAPYLPKSGAPSPEFVAPNRRG